MNKRKRWAVGVACGLVVGVVAFSVCDFLFKLSADVHDTNYLSPDEAYTATLHNVNTGAAGSYSQALLRRTTENKEMVLVDGGWEFVDRVEWRDSKTLVVTTGLEGKPDPIWPKSWQGIKIVL